MNPAKMSLRLILMIGLGAANVCPGWALVGADGQTPPLAQDYCTAFVKEAENARDSRQKLELEALNEKLDKKLTEINEKTSVLEKWVTQREAILAEATGAVLKIYDSMDPVYAAQELAKLDQVAASAILRKMKPKKSSDVLKEMDPVTAARIVAIISSEANLDQGSKQ